MYQINGKTRNDSWTQILSSSRITSSITPASSSYFDKINCFGHKTSHGGNNQHNSDISELNHDNDSLHVPQSLPNGNGNAQQKPVTVQDFVDTTALQQLKDDLDIHVPNEDKYQWSPADVPQFSTSEDPLYVYLVGL